MIYFIFGCSLGANGMETMETMDIINKFPPKKQTQWTVKTPVDTMDNSPID